MNFNLKNVFVLLFSICIFTLSARGVFDNNKEENTLTLTGIIKIKGNEPMTFIALVDDDGKNYLLSGGKADDLGTNHQLRLVEIKGKVVNPETPPRPAEIEVLSFKILD